MKDSLSWMSRYLSRDRLAAFVPTKGQFVTLAAIMALGAAGMVEAQTMRNGQPPRQEEQQQYNTPSDFSELAKGRLPAVVNVSTTQRIAATEMQDEEPGQRRHPRMPPGFEEFFRDFFGQDPGQFFDRGPLPNAPERDLTALGSGFVIDPQGYIVTNNHVVEGADEIKVILHDETELKAEVVGTDPRTDLALLKVEPEEPLPAVQWGNSDTAEIGDWVMAIGNPFGLGGSVTTGIISARARDIHAGPYDSFIQTDASINRGNSGGPLFNMDGQVIGVNTAIFSPSGGNIGIGFAVPSAMAKDVIAQLRETGTVERGYLGVTIQQVTDEIAEGLGMDETQGALVTTVIPDSPADEAGVQAGDVILTFNGQDVPDVRELQRIVADTPVDEEVQITVLRNGERTDLSAQVARLEEPEEMAALDPGEPEEREGELGLALSRLTPEMRERFQIGSDISGALVVDVAPNSPAAETNLAPGDVIVQAGQKQVEDPEDVKNAVEQAREAGKGSLLVLREREGNRLFVSLPLESRRG